jgi:tetratricopeptide (TPR) repeat protein
MEGFDLGTYGRAVSTRSPEAQRWFDIGLNWCYGFNHEEAIGCFEKVLSFDPGCAMAHWGIAYAAGPFYNLTWREHGAAEAEKAARRGFDHVRLAGEAASGASPAERRLIEALAARYQKPHAVTATEFGQWDDAYAAEMRRVHYEFPDDQDVTALFVEALMMRTVRRLWDLKTGAPAPGSDVLEALGICERAIARAGEAGAAAHPALLHLHIHLLEMSTMPERALGSARRLGGMCPDAGHLNHMPAHIYVLCGMYEEARSASEEAIRADDRYLARTDAPGCNYLLACCHDLHLMMFACMFLGQSKPALEAAGTIRGLATRDIIALPDRPKLTQTMEGYYAMKSHVLVRFGRWHEIIDEPMADDPALYVLTTAMQHYAKAVAHATVRDFAAADRHRELFCTHLDRIPPERRFLSNPARASLAVGAALLDGELAYHKGRHDEAYRQLRRAVELDDNLSYTEPWAWMHPPRHALAALLLDQGHVSEAERVYRDDLGLSGTVQRCAQHPDNVWALHGLVECLRRRGEPDELPRVRARLRAALAKADVPISSSCLCRTNMQQPTGCCSSPTAGADAATPERA